MNWLSQIFSVSLFNLRSIPERKGSAISAAVGIAGVVLVLVGVLAIAEGFSKAMTSTVPKDVAILLRTGSLEDAAAAKKELEELVKAAARPETNRLYRTVCRWWKEIEVLIITGATTGKVEANNTAIKNIKRTARGYRNRLFVVAGEMSSCR